MLLFYGRLHIYSLLLHSQVSRSSVLHCTLNICVQMLEYLGRFNKTRSWASKWNTLYAQHNNNWSFRQFSSPMARTLSWTISFAGVEARNSSFLLSDTMLSITGLINCEIPPTAISNLKRHLRNKSHSFVWFITPPCIPFTVLPKIFLISSTKKITYRVQWFSPSPQDLLFAPGFTLYWILFIVVYNIGKKIVCFVTESSLCSER